MSFGAYVRKASVAGIPVVQPRMGMSDPVRMRAGLLATRRARATTVGTITLDSYTRVGQLTAARDAVRAGTELNGCPLTTHPIAVTRAVLASVRDDCFPVQVRHGSAAPLHIIRAMLRLSLEATEGGPVSYCLPYGRTPLADSVRNWAECCEVLSDTGAEPHLESFGGCMLGQLCPPSQLVAIGILETLFFRQHGLRSVSVSYAQQTHAGQDAEAVLALRRLCGEMLTGLDWHVVIYAYMGVYPATVPGAYRLLGEAARLAARTGSERLVVKTVTESSRIPSIAENVAALEYAGVAARQALSPQAPSPDDSQCYREARALVEAVLNLDADVGRALLLAFRRGYLDIPYCLHPDNRGRTRGSVGPDGRLYWAELGALPLTHLVRPGRERRLTSATLLKDLHYVRDKFDRVGR